MAKSKKADQNYRFDGQHDDEEVLFLFRRHPVVMRLGLVAVMVGMVVGMLPVTIWPERLGYLWFILPGMALGGLFLFYQWIGWYYSVFILTDQRFVQIEQKGMFDRAVVDIGLDKIQNINYSVSGIQETLLGFGTISLQTFVGDLVLDKIHHPAKIQEKLVKIIKELGYSSYGTPITNPEK